MARTGRYKALIVVALVVMAVGLFLLTHLRPDTPQPLVWLWMAVTGLGVGPAFAVFTLAVQNAVPVSELGVATSSLTLFQQVGGTVGLAITGTIFGSALLEEVPKQLVAPACRRRWSGGFLDDRQRGAARNLSGVGDLGAALLASGGEQIKPFVDAMVVGIHEAFSIATARPNSRPGADRAGSPVDPADIAG